MVAKRSRVSSTNVADASNTPEPAGRGDSLRKDTGSGCEEQGGEEFFKWWRMGTQHSR